MLAENAVKSRALRINGFAQILTAAKGLAFAGEEHGAYLGVVVGFSEGPPQLEGHSAVKRIVHVRPVEGKAQSRSVCGGT